MKGRRELHTMRRTDARQPCGGQTDWSQINPSLYAICFMGKAKKSETCDCCLSATHKVDDDSLMSEADPDVAKRLKAIESSVVALIHPASDGSTRSRDRERSGETCRNWNRNRCSFPGCRFAYQCVNCKGATPRLNVHYGIRMRPP